MCVEELSDKREAIETVSHHCNTAVECEYALTSTSVIAFCLLLGFAVVYLSHCCCHGRSQGGILRVTSLVVSYYL